MSEQSEREWKSYLLSKGVFGNALRFAHLEKPEEVDRTSPHCHHVYPATNVRNTTGSQPPLFSLKKVSGPAAFCDAPQMSLAQADGAEVGGAGAGAQGGHARGVPRPELSAVARRTKHRSDAELLR